MLRPRILALFIAVATSLEAATVLGTTAGPVIELAASPANVRQRAPSVAFDGTRYVMVWEDSRSTTSGIDLFIARLDVTGALQDPMGISLLTPPVAGDQTEPSISYAAGAGAHVIVWTDPRGASLDIYAARFIPGSGTTIPSGGQEISGEAPDADNAPHAAFATTSWLIAWQATTAGSSRIRARRYYPTLDIVMGDETGILMTPGGTSELKPRIAGVGTDFVVTWEDDRNAAVSGIDIYGRRLPDFGAVPASAGTQLATGPFGQQKPDPVLLGPSTLALAWEDDRLGAGVDRNLWRNLYDPTTLAPLAAGEAAVTLAPDAQQRPRIAADANGAMMIWQDFRDSSIIGIIYGARLDANGNVRDTNGFPLFAFNQNAFEHAITKGPNNDYLATAVRFDVSAPRIFYRIVRDEAPAGTMSASGTLQVPADGTSIAQITFGPARGTSNTFDVVDGTQYTVTLSRADVTLTVADTAPAVPGHQVSSFNGAVSFGLFSLAHGSVTVSIESVEGTATGSGTVIFENVPPVASNVVVGPPNPTSNQDLSVTYAYSDLNNDPENGTQIEWLRNSGIQSQYTGMTSVPAIATIRDDQWRVRVTPRDGLNNGQFVFSNTVLIGNTPPAAVDPRIDPNMDVKTGTELRARYMFADVDSDPESGSALRWYDHGVELPALRDLDRVAMEMVIKGQEWSFTVVPNDGLDAGVLATSPAVIVGNTTPVANAGMNGRLLERRTFTFDGSGSTDIDPQDVLRYRWTLATGTPPVTLSDSSSVAPSFVAPSIRSTVIYTFELVVSDGEADSPVDAITVEVNPVIDTDADGLDDEEEVIYGTDPQLADTDRDGLRDADEILATTNPLDEDTDDDGVRDGAEGRACPMCEVMPFLDSDGDQIIDPLEPDSDGDGLVDGLELSVVTAPSGTSSAAGHFVSDADRDTFTNPTLADTDLDTLVDGVEDANQNGRLDPGESDPNDPSDPPRACTPNGNECPPGTECQSGFCAVPAVVDGGLMCRKLVDQMIECCMGGCANGTLVEPECAAQGALEQCGVAAQQCVVGSCSGTDPVTPGGDNCGCTTSGGARDRDGAFSLFALIALAAITRRRGSSSRRRTVR